ncbi:MAG: hypothetical protein PHX01_07385, partial [Clostridia bacterium]|nr:hypothetical protein [Clostridia bacterium]
KKVKVKRMKKIKSKQKLCLICMEEHEVDIVEVMEETVYKGEVLSFNAVYEYCINADEYLETEEMIRANSLAIKEARQLSMASL